MPRKKAERLSPVPEPRRGKRPGKGKVADAPPVPDLSHIAEALRPLAVPLADVAFMAGNAVVHPDEQIEDLRASLRQFGQVEPLVLNKREGWVIGGNGRLRAMLAEGWTHAAVCPVDLERSRANALSLALNRSTAGRAWDAVALDALLREVSTGCDERLDAMLASLAAEVGVVPPDVPAAPEDPGPQVDRAAELQAKWQTAAGQLWEVPSLATPGRSHRLLCGDSTKAEDVGRLMGGERAGLMNTDPPYGVGYANDERPNPGVAKPRVANDEFRDDELQAFLESVFRLAVAAALTESAAWYLWHAHLTQGFFAAAAAAAAANVVLHRQIIWVKPVLLLGRGHYHWKHEPCFMGWVQGHQPPDYGRGNGERDQTTVWEVAGVSQADRKEFNHSTPKPVGLFDVPMVKHLKPGEIAYEPFAGSAPQFVAAEQTGRLCYGVEISPAYVAVDLERLSGLGLTPRLVT